MTAESKGDSLREERVCEGTKYGKVLYSIAILVMDLIYDTMEMSTKNYPLKCFNR